MTKSMSSIPDVAIIIAAYNAEATIARAVKSALAEPEVKEVVVVDDGSTDATIERAAALEDGTGRLKILSQPENRGPSAARNRAIQESTSPWIGILDADDFFLPGRISGLHAFEANADLIADDMWQVPENAVDGPRRSMLDGKLSLPRPIGFVEFVLSNVSGKGRQRTELGFIKPLMRRDFLTANRICYQESMRLGEDFELYARALSCGGRLWLVPAQGYVSVVRPNSLSGRHSENDLLQLRDSNILLGRQPGLNKLNNKVHRKHYLSIDCRLQWRILIRAIKNKNLREALSAFLRPWPVPSYLARQLMIQSYLGATGRRGKDNP